MRVLPVTLASMLRDVNGEDPSPNAEVMDAIIGALNEVDAAESSGTETRLTISLKTAEPLLLRLLNSSLEVE
ncbi:MAG: hypothetical protein KDA78_13470 [Planctomycetaceae bacterium]|nr:hypothetical protein [Planctomycetaceae bacterium]